MHPNAIMLNELFNCLNEKDHQRMAAYYDPDARFEDIAFNLRGRKRIHAMWHMISETDLRASFKVLHADDRSGDVDLTDDYTFSDTGRGVHNPIRSRFRFRDGVIVEQRDECDALRWGIQALGPVKGRLSWLFPAKRRSMAMKKLETFIESHPEYAGVS